MTWGRQVEFLKLVEEQTGVTPASLQNRPTLSTHLWYYREVYSDLSMSRNYTSEGMPLAIPLSEIHAYCEMFGVTDLGARERLLKMVRAMDGAYRKVVDQQQKEAAKKVRH